MNTKNETFYDRTEIIGRSGNEQNTKNINEQEHQSRHKITLFSTQGDVDSVDGIDIPDNCNWVAFDEHLDWPVGLVKYEFDEVNKILYVRRRMMC